MHQIADWPGSGFDGGNVFDEACPLKKHALVADADRRLNDTYWLQEIPRMPMPVAEVEVVVPKMLAPEWRPIAAA